jgi:LPXTG-motif cell wall-anchored protein
MHHRIRTTTAAAFVVIAALLATASPAAASTIYPPSGACTVSPTTAAASETLSFRCEAGTFSASEVVTITVTGNSGADAEIGMVRTAVSTANGRATSDAQGALAAVRVTLPSDASGTYNIAAISATSAGGTAAVTITTDSGLPVTGLDSGSLLSLWIGGGALVLAGVAVVVAVVMRRRASD